MEGEVLDLPFCQIFGVERFERHAIIAHPFLSMPAHLLVAFPRYLPILLV